MKIILNEIEEYKNNRKKWENMMKEHKTFAVFFSKMIDEPILEKREETFRDFEKYFDETRPKPDRFDGPEEIKIRFLLFLCRPYTIYVNRKKLLSDRITYGGHFDINVDRILANIKDLTDITSIKVGKYLNLPLI